MTVISQAKLPSDEHHLTLVMIMAWCHQAISHYLNQCWPMVSLGHSKLMINRTFYIWLISNWCLSEGHCYLTCCLFCKYLKILSAKHLPFCSVFNALTHWGRDKMATFSQTKSLNVFSWMKMYEFRLKFHWNLFLRVKLTMFQHWFR